jgi:hypothetical protein
MPARAKRIEAPVSKAILVQAWIEIHRSSAVPGSAGQLQFRGRFTQFCVPGTCVPGTVYLMPGTQGCGSMRTRHARGKGGTVQLGPGNLAMQ